MTLTLILKTLLDEGKSNQDNVHPQKSDDDDSNSDVSEADSSSDSDFGLDSNNYVGKKKGADTENKKGKGRNSNNKRNRKDGKSGKNRKKRKTDNSETRTTSKDKSPDKGPRIPEEKASSGSGNNQKASSSASRKKKTIIRTKRGAKATILKGEYSNHDSHLLQEAVTYLTERVDSERVNDVANLIRTLRSFDSGSLSMFVAAASVPEENDFEKIIDSITTGLSKKNMKI